MRYVRHLKRQNGQPPFLFDWQENLACTMSLSTLEFFNSLGFANPFSCCFRIGKGQLGFVSLNA